MPRLGRRLIAELYDCAPELLNDLSAVRTICRAVARQARVPVVASAFHQSSAGGLAGVMVMGEACVSIHTWPEHRYAAADLVARGEALSLNEAIEFMLAAFKAERVSMLEVHGAVVPTTPTCGAIPTGPPGSSAASGRKGSGSDRMARRRAARARVAG